MKTKTMELELAQRKNITDIVAEYSSRLAGFIRKRVNRLEDAEDILQEVFYQLTKADQLMKPIDELTAWLFAVTRNRITDFYRKKRPEFLPEIYSDNEMEEMENSLRDLIADNGDTPETAFLRSLVWEELALALKNLPPEQCEAFELTEFEGLSFNEISELTGEKVNTLISRKRYAVLYLRERLSIIYNEIINY